MQQGLKRRQLKSEQGDSVKRQDSSELLRQNKATSSKKNGRHGGGRFDIDLWFLLTLECWLFDFGRPIYALYISHNFPLSLPSIGDYCHMAYNIVTAFVLLQLFQRCSRPPPKWLQHLLVVVFVMGASIHLVGDSLQHRLIHSGYKLHLSVRDNPIIKALQPTSLVHTFELIYFYDEILGHEMWYIPLYIAYSLYFCGCFIPSTAPRGKLGVGGWLLVIFSAGFESYLVTEGQIFPLFFCTMVVMVIVLLWRHCMEKMVIDNNGIFLLSRVMVTMVIVGMWVWWLWDDEQLRDKYPGWLYIPEPWSYISLYVMKL